MFLNKIYKKLKRVVQAEAAEEGVLEGKVLRVPRQKHTLTRKDLSKNVLKVLYRLKKAGFDAFLVGGGVRDLLLNTHTKDYDVATNATPEEIAEFFANARIIGRRFRLVHILFRGETIEVATLRGEAAESDEALPRFGANNIFGTIEEDAWRRDFTINSLFYDIGDFSIIDYTGGMKDLSKRLIRIIGEPQERFKEDPIRLLRALRFAAKLDFTLHQDTERAVKTMGDLLIPVSRSRLLLEFEKCCLSGYAARAFPMLQRYDYLRYIFPDTARLLSQADQPHYRQMINQSLESTDQRYHSGKSLNPAFLISVILWPVFQNDLEKELNEKRFFQAVHAAITSTIDRQQQCVAVPKRYLGMIRSVWLLQYNLEKRRPKRIYSLLRHRYFRAGFDLLGLRAAVDPALQEVYDWWGQIQKTGPGKRDAMVDQLRVKKS